MKRLGKIFALTLALVLVLVQGVEATHQLDRPHWQRGNSEAVIAVDDRLDKAFVKAAVVKWSEAYGIRLDYVDSCEGYDRCIVVEAADLDAAYFGYATWSWSGEHLLWARVQFNTDYQSKWDRGLACHEIGHAIGLGHRATTSSCMHSRASAVNRPDAHDFKALRSIYTHWHE